MGARRFLRKQLNRMAFPRSTRWSWSSTLPATSVDYERLVGDGSRSDIVMAWVGWRMRVFTEPPVMMTRTTRSGEQQPVMSHPLLDLLETPNDVYDGATLLSATIMSYTVDGNAYWWIIPSRGGRPAQLWWIPHWMIEPKSPENGNQLISHYEYKPGLALHRLEPDRVVHFRNVLDPDDMRKGLSPLKTVMRELYSDAEAANWTAALLRNGGVPGVVVSPAQGARKDPNADRNLKTTRRYLKDRVSGDNRGGVLTISGPMTVQQFGFNPQQMNLRDLRRLPEERACAVMGIPPIIASLGAGLDKSTYTNYQVAERVVYRSNIVPTWNRFARTIRQQLLKHYEDDYQSYRIQFDTSEIDALQEDRTVLSDRLTKQLVSGGITLAEWRRQLGYDTGEGDQYEVFTRPINLIEIPANVVGRIPARVGVSLEPETPPAIGAGDDEEGGDDDEESETEATRAGPAFDPRGPVLQIPYDDDTDLVRKQITEAQQVLAAALYRIRERVQGVSASEIQAAFVDLGGRMEDAWRAIYADELKGLETKQDPNDELLIERLMQSIRVATWEDDVMAPTFDRQSMRTITASVSTVDSILGLGVNLPDFTMRQLVADGGTRLGLIDLNQQARDSVFQALHDGRAAGEGPAPLGRRIREYVPRGRFRHVATRALLIARTETAWVQNR